LPDSQDATSRPTNYRTSKFQKISALLHDFALPMTFLIAGIKLKQERQFENTADISGSYSSKCKMCHELTRIVQSDFRGVAWTQAMVTLEIGAKVRFEISFKNELCNYLENPSF
jgi:hypothetical protein